MKLTLFTLPKPFSGIYRTIQENALRSWAALEPKPNLILFGSEEGTAEMAKKYGARHEPSVRTNELNTPLVSDIFQRATSLTTGPFQCFLNCDIILDPALPAMVDRAHCWNSRALLVSRRWDLEVNRPLATDQPDWFSVLRERTRSEGELYSHLGMDLFVFPTGLLDHMPPFSIGWPGAKYDNWIIYTGRRHGIPIVDITDAITTVHQNHPPGASTDPRKASEHWASLDLLGGYGCCYDIHDATHVMRPDGAIEGKPWRLDRTLKNLKRAVQRGRYHLRKTFFGFRYSQMAG